MLAKQPGTAQQSEILLQWSLYTGLRSDPRSNWQPTFEMTPGSKPFTVVSSRFFTKIWSYRAEIEIFLNKYQIFFKGFDESSWKLDMNITYTFTCGNFDLFYIKFSWIFLEFRNWYARKNSKRASRTNCKLQCVFIQCSCDLSPKWPMFV